MMVVPSMEVIGAAQIGMLDDRVFGGARFAVEPVGDDGGDAFVGQRADSDGAGGDEFGSLRIDILEQAQHAQAGPKALLRMRPIGEDGADQPLGIGPDRAPPATESIGRPFGVTAMRTGHMLGVGPMPAAAMATLMGGEALTPMEQLEGAGRGAKVDLLADQAGRNPVEKAIDLDVIIERDAGEAPFGELIVGVRQRRHCWPFDRLEQMAAADAEPPHNMGVDALDGGGDRRVGLCEREESLTAKPAEDIGLSETDAGFDLGFVARLARPGGQYADAVMGRHHAVAAIDLGIVERGPLDAGLQIIGYDEARHAANMRTWASIQSGSVCAQVASA